MEANLDFGCTFPYHTLLGGHASIRLPIKNTNMCCEDFVEFRCACGIYYQGTNQELRPPKRCNAALAPTHSTKQRLRRPELRSLSQSPCKGPRRMSYVVRHGVAQRFGLLTCSTSFSGWGCWPMLLSSGDIIEYASKILSSTPEHWWKLPRR
jgi:hypothetical protein